jgi:soluble lytic murein transglycosylase-like protein
MPTIETDLRVLGSKRLFKGLWFVLLTSDKDEQSRVEYWVWTVLGMLGELCRQAAQWCLVAVLLALILTQCGAVGKTAEIPRAADQHKAALIRTARAVWGMDAPIAVFAAQIHTESRWNAQAKSHVGAQGLAQFMPATAAWLPTYAPETGEPMPYNPGWAIRALVTYDLYLWRQIGARGAASDKERMAMALSAYNGGLGWINRDKRLASGKGLDPLRWFEHVETVNAGRSAANWRENRNYPRLILLDRQRTYEGAGWGSGL